MDSVRETVDACLDRCPEGTSARRSAFVASCESFATNASIKADIAKLPRLIHN
jgi:hypothetical protein